jgi:predicted hotdog family 3-hydroxylacyl-ACP dehydratase
MTPSKPRYAVADVLPHAGPMILIDEICDCSDDTLTSKVTIRNSSLFLTAENVVPSWAGIEYMAQSIAAWAGIQAKHRGKPVKAGYLVGSRHYYASKPVFQLGDTLKIAVTRQYLEGQLAVFDCEISSPHVHVAATLNVFQPE